jgi:iron(III) transport system substrate-binding protein
VHHAIPRIAAAAAVAVLLSACGTGGAEPGPAAGTDTLVVYTNSHTEGRAEWLTERAAAAGFPIEVVRVGGGDATNKLIAERGNPVADVVFGLNNMYFEQLKAAGVLEPYAPEWAGEVDPVLGDPAPAGDAYWSIVQQGIVLAYDAADYPDGTAPKDWPDLWNDPRFHDRYETQTSLGGATTQLVLAGILARYLDPAGELGVSDEGWAQIQQYYQYGSPAEQGVDLYARISEGEVDLGQMFTSGIPARDAQYGTRTEVARPAVGVPFAVEQVALVRGSGQPERARAFIDWFGSAETQSAWSAQFGSMPANEGAIAHADPAVVDFHRNLRHQDIDWGFVQQNMGTWIEKIELEYLG